MLNERKITDVNGKWFFIQNIKKWLQIEAQFFLQCRGLYRWLDDLVSIASQM
jgi:hypothetical protein